MTIFSCRINLTLLLFAAAVAGLVAQTLPPGSEQMPLSRVVEGVASRGPSFSVNPAEDEFYKVRVFEEPLVPCGGKPSLAENRALADALVAFAARTERDDFSAITQFLASHSTSPWCASTRFCLGLEYYHTGFYSKCIEEWEQAWRLIRNGTDLHARRLADRTIGELTRMHARIGGAARLAEIIDELRDRPLSGSATEMIDGARQALDLMRNKPQVAFRCGPLALRSLCSKMGTSGIDVDHIVQESASTSRGFSLLQLSDLSRSFGLNLQLAHRKANSSIVLPSVIHWKVGHYAAVVGQEGDLYNIVDPTFGKSTWISHRALEAESSGFFAIPSGPLPDGWRRITAVEGQEVWGKGVTSNNNPDNTTPNDLKAKSAQNSCGMPVYNFHLMLASLNISDTPVGYLPPVGPAAYFTLTYNQREANQPANFSYANFGPKWTFNWLSFITDTPSAPSADVTCYVGGGGTETYTGYSTNNTFAVQPRSQTVLRRTSSSSYEMRFPDGSKGIYDRTDGTSGTTRKVFLTQIIDSAGNAVTLNYDSSLRLTNYVDAIGQKTTLSYGLGDGRITRVTDPFGRYAEFQYDEFGNFTKITDVIGLASEFGVGGAVIPYLKTPYGTTTFSAGSSGRTRWIEATDPQGDKERVEFNELSNIGIAGSEPGTLVPTNIYTRNSFLTARNTFYWDKKAWREAPGDYTKARLYHWIHTLDYASADGVLESSKLPFENRVWYNYPGQAQSSEGATLPGTNHLPSRIARVLDDGSTQVWLFNRNSLGKITAFADPVGRNFAFFYGTNNVDLLEVQQVRGAPDELVAWFTYNSQHLPLTAVDASGRTNRFYYNARGQLVTNINTLNEATVFTYNTNGYLLVIDGPLSGTNDATRFTYDSYGRVRTVTDSEGYTVTTDYDGMDRPTTNSFPDGTFESIVYNKLEPETFRDRQGGTTKSIYNSLRQLVRVEDATNWVTRFDWCRCGDLKSVTDPLGRMTSWQHDVQGRIKSKIYADGSRVEYTYENTTSRLKSIKDEKGQLKNFGYFLDDNLQQVSYPNAAVATPTVSYTYETNYDRLLTMQDGIGMTTFGYYPITSTPTLGAGRLATIDGPLASDTITFEYDGLGRVTNRYIGFIGSQVTYDAMGRVTNANNSMGVFAYAYTNATRRLHSIIYPSANGQKSYFDYFGNSGDQRLKEIKHLASGGAVLSKFNYLYNSGGQITNWTQQSDAEIPKAYRFTYDPIGQLTNAVLTSNSTTLATYSYAFDLAGNRTSEKIDATTYKANFNPLNQIINQELQNLGLTNTYEWDAENRMVAFTRSGQRTELAYDGFGRFVRIIEKSGAVTNSVSKFVWCGDELCQRRFADDSVEWRFFPHGEQTGGAFNSFITRDHLGSTRDYTDGSGALIFRKDYDPFGRINGAGATLRGFGGLYFQIVAKINSAVYRGYDSDTGRWLNRDPVEEAGGLNLYRYAYNDPVNFVDPDGLCPVRNEGGQGPGNSAGNGGNRPPKTPRIANSAGPSGEGGGAGNAANAQPGRSGAFRLAKEAAGIPRSAQPSRVYYERIYDQPGNVQGRVYEFRKPDGSAVTIREHSLGHVKGAHGPHFNAEIRPPGGGPKQPLPSGGHYYFEP